MKRLAKTSVRPTQKRWGRLLFVLAVLPVLVFTPAFAPAVLVHGHAAADDDLHLHRLAAAGPLRLAGDLNDWHDSEHPSALSIAGPPLTDDGSVPSENGIVFVIAHPVMMSARSTAVVSRPVIAPSPLPVNLAQATTTPSVAWSLRSDFTWESDSNRSHVAGILQSNHSLLL